MKKKGEIRSVRDAVVRTLRQSRIPHVKRIEYKVGYGYQKIIHLEKIIVFIVTTYNNIIYEQYF